MKKVLLVTAGVFHPTYIGRLALHESLKRMEEFSFIHVSSLEKLPPNLENFLPLSCTTRIQNKHFSSEAALQFVVDYLEGKLA